MLLNVGEVVRSIGALLDDPANQEFDKDYCLPYINLAWMDIAAEFNAIGLQYQEEVSVISALPAGTSDLLDYQRDGQALEAMLLPTLVEWKRVGQPDVEYQFVPLREVLPDVLAAQGIAAWQYRKGKLIITPSTIAVDLRVTYKAYSLDFVDPTTAIVVGAGNLIAYKSCEFLCSPTIRNNPQAVTYFMGKFREAADNFEVLCVKQKNLQGFRIGRSRTSRNRGSRRPLIIVSSGSEATMGSRHTPVEAADGARTAFTFAGLPASPLNYQVYVDGLMTVDFVQVGQVITFNFVPVDQAEIFAYY